jgi:hypothetical protein
MAISNISVIGEAVYPHLNKPDVKWNEAGEYKVTLKVAKSDASEMLKLYNKAIDDSLKLAEEQHKGKGITHAPKPYNEENGFVFFKFKMKATGVNKMRVAYELVPYYAPMIGAGITARLKAVQVIELVEGKDSNLFKEEDGYETATPEPDVISNEKTTVQESKDF